MSIPPSPSPIRIFYSYSRKDEHLSEALQTHLALLERQGLITGWKNRQIEAGAEWDTAIKNKLAEADIILLLVSPDFMASDYIWDKELAPAMKRHSQGSAHVIPIILRSTDLAGASFMALQCLPRDAKPVEKWGSVDDAMVDVVSGIRQVAERLQRERLQSASQSANASANLELQRRRPTRGSLRKIIEAVLSADDLDAFCFDHFPPVKQRFGSGIQYTAKITLLLENADLVEVLDHLKAEYPQKVQANIELLRWQ